MSQPSMDEQLTTMLDEGRITSDDVEEVQRFASFLQASAGLSRQEKARLYLEHYPDEH